MHIAAEDRTIGTVLDLDPVCLDVDRRVRVVPLERGHRRLLTYLREAGRAADRG